MVETRLKRKLREINEAASSKLPKIDKPKLIQDIDNASSKLSEMIVKPIVASSKPSEMIVQPKIPVNDDLNAKMKIFESELSKIVGLEELKLQLRKWAKGFLLDEHRRRIGLNAGPKKPPHMVFLGNPGTGKTTVARILGKLLHSIGLLSRGNVIEVQRSDLVGEWIGQTESTTREKINEAKGSVLFVDEAYRLAPHNLDYCDFGKEALEEIMSSLEDDDRVVIFAGYTKPMKRVFSVNEGFCRRVTLFFEFKDLSCDQLANMALIKMNNHDKKSTMYGFTLDHSCTLEVVSKLIEQNTTEKLRKKFNGGLVDHMLNNAREILDSRFILDSSYGDEISIITLQDLQAGLKLMVERFSTVIKWDTQTTKTTQTTQTTCKVNKKAKIQDFESELSKIVGLEELKLQLRKWAKGLLLDEKRGINLGRKKAPHMAFLGNPGTGKTTVARILGKLLHSIGFLSCGEVIEVQRSDLVGEYIGHTAPKTRKKINEAAGSVLFVDEAYRLVPPSTPNDFGKEALEEIMSVLEDDDLVVIFAGYTKPMKKVFSSNEGFCRRVTFFYEFNDYSCSELAEMVMIKMDKLNEESRLFGFKLDPSCTLDVVRGIIEQNSSEKLRKKFNGGLVDHMLNNAREILDSRLNPDSNHGDELSIITVNDLEGGLKLTAQRFVAALKWGKQFDYENDIQTKMKEFESELSKIVGLEELKLQLRKWAKGLLLDAKRRAMGINLGRKSPHHMAFLGNPGTGKTTVARILGKLLHCVGVLSCGEVIEVQRSDLVGKHLGETALKTRKKIDEAEGSVLFVDEAYRLAPGMTNDLGKEALEEIMSSLEDDDLVVIFAGYKEPMKSVFSINDGFRRRVTNFYEFDDFSCHELAEILTIKMNNLDEKSPLFGFKLHPLCTSEAIREVIENNSSAKLRSEINGGLVDQMLKNAKENLDSRLNIDTTDNVDEIMTITVDDLVSGLQLLVKSIKDSNDENNLTYYL